MNVFKTRFISESDAVFDTNLESASNLYDAGYEQGKAEGGGGTYLTPEELENIKSIPNKVDKVDGYGLSRLSASDEVITYEVISEDGINHSATSYTTKAVDKRLGDVESALDHIIELQEQYKSYAVNGIAEDGESV